MRPGCKYLIVHAAGIDPGIRGGSAPICNETRLPARPRSKTHASLQAPSKPRAMRSTHVPRHRPCTRLPSWGARTGPCVRGQGKGLPESCPPDAAFGVSERSRGTVLAEQATCQSKGASHVPACIEQAPKQRSCPPCCWHRPCFRLLDASRPGRRMGASTQRASKPLGTDLARLPRSQTLARSLLAASVCCWRTNTPWSRGRATAVAFGPRPLASLTFPRFHVSGLHPSFPFSGLES